MTDLAREDVERLVRIEAKLDDSLNRAMEDRLDHDRDIADVRRDMGDTDRRVGSLENWRYAIGAALLMSSASAVGAAINIVPK